MFREARKGSTKTDMPVFTAWAKDRHRRRLETQLQALPNHLGGIKDKASPANAKGGWVCYQAVSTLQYAWRKLKPHESRPAKGSNQIAR